MARISKVKQMNGKKPGGANGAPGGMMDWFLAHSDVRRSNSGGPRSAEAQNYLNFLWPVALDYYSPLNPVFLNEYVNLDSYNHWPIWMARDGLVPLLWFFKVHPHPGKFQQHILVHEDLAPFVPDEWRNHIGSYRIVSTVNTPLPKTRKFLITGLLMDTYISMEHLEQQLKNAVELVGGPEAFAKSEVLAFLPPRIDGFGSEHKQEYHSQCIFLIARYFGTHVQSIPWRKLESMDLLDGYEVIEFNERLLCSDSYLTQMPLFRGARLLESPHVRPANDQFIALSPYHGVSIQHQIKGKCMLQNPTEKDASKYFEAFAYAMRSEANKRFPWPNWFTELTRVIEHQKPS